MNPNSEDAPSKPPEASATCTWADEHWQTFYLDAPIAETNEPSAGQPPAIAEFPDSSPFLTQVRDDPPESLTPPCESTEGEVTELVETVTAVLGETVTFDPATQTTIEVLDLVEASATTTIETIVSPESDQDSNHEAQSTEQPPEPEPDAAMPEPASEATSLAAEDLTINPAPTRLASLSWMTWDDMMQNVAKSPPADGAASQPHGETRAIQLTWSTWSQVMSEPAIDPSEARSPESAPDSSQSSDWSDAADSGN